MTDTIFAQASARGRAGVAVIRVSGPEAFAALEALAGRMPEARVAALRRLHDPATGEALDDALVVRFPGPASFTGEDTAELQVHGSAAVCRAVLAALGALPGLRMAEPGEFTRRALMNGRLDLAQVEGLADLVAAETLAQQRLALRVMQGGLSRLAAGWRAALVRALALVEATIDFADEDLPDDLAAAVGPILAVTARAMEAEVRGSDAAERVREGFEVALVGAPNVGKSTLLNALAGREAALTSEVAGTTRDVIEVHMDLGGLAVTLLDMAGLRSGGDRVEALGIDRARQRAARADLRVFLIEAAELDGLGVAVEPGDLVVGAKADLRPAAAGLAVSGTTGSGIDRLLAAVGDALQHRASAASLVSRERQRRAIEQAAAALGEARRHLEPPAPAVELAAEEIRSALRALDFLVGKVDVEAVLDLIFESFCLGK
jgi:tRNA modification GTPase